MEMTAEKKLAISLVVPSKEVSAAKAELEPESLQHVDFYVHVKGVLKKGKDVQKKVPAALPQADLLKALLAKMNRATRQAFLRDFVAGKLEVPEELDRELKEDWDAVAETTVRRTNGRVTFAGTAEVVTAPVPEPAATA